MVLVTAVLVAAALPKRDGSEAIVIRESAIDNHLINSAALCIVAP